MSQKLKRFLLKNQIKYECFHCKNDGKWLNKNLTLQVDHIDGNNKNNELCNLRFLCPNCHSQTNTFSGRNKKIENNIWKNVDEKIWIDSINSSFSVSEAIKKLNFNSSNMNIRNYVKELIREGKALLLKEKDSEIIKSKINEIQNSGINFSEYGWVIQVSKILNITPQKVSLWMKRNMLSFYNDKCFKRKL